MSPKGEEEENREGKERVEEKREGEEGQGEERDEGKRSNDIVQTFQFNTLALPVLANNIAIYGGTGNSATDSIHIFIPCFFLFLASFVVCYFFFF